MDVKAVGYIRVSTTDQARDGWSLAGQRKRIKAFCEAKGWTLAHVYADEGISGKASSHRPQYDRMLRDALSNGITHIVAMKLDRLGRSARQLLDVYERLERKGVTIVTIDDGIDTSTAQGKLFRTILAGVAEFERDLASERTKAALATARTAGTHVGRAPYGWRVESGRLVEDATEQGYIHRALLMAEGAASIRAIAAEFNAAGVRPRSGGQWHPTQIARMLERARFAEMYPRARANVRRELEEAGVSVTPPR